MAKGGVSFNDRTLAAEVRSLALNKVKKLFEMPIVEMTAKDYELHNAVLIRLAGTILPRLNEHTGEDGDPIQHSITGIEYLTPKNEDTNKSDDNSTPSVQ